jgi:5,5'-dehydrodivanillate O-demethylase
VMTAEENEAYTRVGPGTPGGELLRRYWQPVAGGDVLEAARSDGDGSEDGPAPPAPATHFVRVLGEDLVLFRDLCGRIGLIADRCAHRGCSLLYGRVEERGIACPYHAGLYWAYLGPTPAPVIPPFDVWARRDGRLRAVVQPVLDCNWLQTMENSVDPAHLQILHQELIGRGRKPESTTRGFIDDVVSTEFSVSEWGIVKHRRYRDGLADDHPLIFPNSLREGNAMQIRVAMDDTHTAHYRVYFDPLRPGEAPRGEDDPVPVSRLAPYKEPADALHPRARFNMWISVAAQDHMAWETQGPVTDRTAEHLSYSDRGVALFRRLLKENMDRVARGLDPMGVVRDPGHPIIDTHLDASLAEMALTGRLHARVAPAGAASPRS